MLVKWATRVLVEQLSSEQQYAVGVFKYIIPVQNIFANEHCVQHVLNMNSSRQCTFNYGPLTRYVKLRVVHAPGMPGTFSRHRFQRKPLVSDPGMHHGTCVTHVPWCMSGSLTRCGGENVPGIPGACATRTFTHLARGPCMTRLPISGSYDTQCTLKQKCAFNFISN